MSRKRKQILPFRIPFFRIFYSTTYTIVLIITLCFLAITPGSALLEAIESGALQYVFIIGGVYILTAIIAIFTYTSRLYTNRIVLAAVGKAYIPVEPDEISKKIRAMIVAQLNRSAIVSWEAKPRDVKGEIMSAEKENLLPAQGDGMLGTIVPVDVNNPPWGMVQHRGWTAPSSIDAEYPSNTHFDVVLAELPHLLEARAISLAPNQQQQSDSDHTSVPDQRVVELLRRQEKAGLREYLTQLSYLGLVVMQDAADSFIDLYERARFSGTPPTISEFKRLMTAFALVMDHMAPLDSAIVEQIRLQLQLSPSATSPTSADGIAAASSTGLRDIDPVAAHTRQTSGYRPQDDTSTESLGSVLHDARPAPTQVELDQSPASQIHTTGTESAENDSLASDAGSVVHHVT